MIRLLSTPATALLAITALSVATADDNPLKGDLARFQGTWKGVYKPNGVTMVYVFNKKICVEIHAA